MDNLQPNLKAHETDFITEFMMNYSLFFFVMCLITITLIVGIVLTCITDIKSSKKKKCKDEKGVKNNEL